MVVAEVERGRAEVSVAGGRGDGVGCRVEYARMEKMELGGSRRLGRDLVPQVSIQYALRALPLSLYMTVFGGCVRTQRY